MKWKLTYTDDWKKAEELAAHGWEMCGAAFSGHVVMGQSFGATYYYFKLPLKEIEEIK